MKTVYYFRDMVFVFFLNQISDNVTNLKIVQLFLKPICQNITFVDLGTGFKMRKVEKKKHNDSEKLKAKNVLNTFRVIL